MRLIFERNLWQVRQSMVRKKLRAKAIYKILTKTYPNVQCELDYKNPYQLLIATVLSAQCTDKRVNQTTPALFKRFGSIKKMAAADIRELEQLVKINWFFSGKGKKYQSFKSEDSH